MSKQLQIRNSTAEFLIFQAEDKAQGVQVFYKDETIWATQKAMATLFDCSTDNIGVHLKNIFESGELDKDSVTEKISATAADGKNYLTQFYKLDAIISVGYRVNSIRAPEFPDVWSEAVRKVHEYFPYIEDGEVPFVAHNKAFDENCLKAVFRAYEIAYPDYSRTIAVSWSTSPKGSL